MTTPEGFRFGCNVSDPLLEVGPGEDYNLPITRRSLEFLAELGFEAVEYSHALHWSDEEVEAVREMTAELGLGAWSLHAWQGGDVLEPEAAARTSAGLTRAAEVALGLGVTRIVHHTSGESLEGKGPERLAREVEVISGAWRPGFRFALENGSKMAQMEYLIALVDAIGPEIAGICVDTGHANLGNELGAARALRMAGSRLITTHLQDNHGQHDEHVAPGDGTIDWDEAAAALREIGYRGCLMLELTDHPGEVRAPQIRAEIGRGAAKARWLAGEVWG